MITISLCMIVRNEEDTLERCLQSVRGIADEIVIVDTGSTDATKAIAARFTDSIHDFKWVDDFAAARNYSFRQATMAYILWLDADDVIEDRERDKWIELKHTLDPSVDTVMMPYHLTFDQTGKPVFSMRRNRLVRRSRGFVWIGAVHEYLEVSGKCFHSDAAVSHKKQKSHTDRNLRMYQRRLRQGETFSPRDLYYYANELYDHALIEEAVHAYEKFWACGSGWVEDRIASCLKLADCHARMGEREKQLQALFRSFELDAPRAEVCCCLGAFYVACKRWREAKIWYLTATILGAPLPAWSMVDMAAWTWLPHVQLCVCCDQLGEYEQAYRHNEIALSYHPAHASMLHNRKYLERRLARDGEKEERRTIRHVDKPVNPEHGGEG